MYQFTGCPCSVCGKALTDGDDIVVCPDCGAPYHRACYEKQGACVYAAKHGAGFEWTPPASARPERKCPNCGAPNPESAARCGHCGYPFEGAQTTPPRLWLRLKQRSGRSGKKGLPPAPSAVSGRDEIPLSRSRARASRSRKFRVGRRVPLNIW